ncbi:non-ribosomal peptide synthetase [Oceanobacillus manasiensis]|uniref:non-ribosomal peptide synthetase n=1 Tax=Oceanobacillus manasiensis TaxID=586413 RepID=UPI000694EB8A|nr:non-ribosomal peptide synthetase [Oceanobacillus manasiensis]
MANETKDYKKELALYLLNKMKQNDIPKELAIKYIKELQSTKKSKDREDMAIIGMGSRFPDAETPDEFWDNIAAGKDSIGPISEQRRKDGERKTGRELNLMKGGFLDSVDKFDPDYFNIPPSLATQMDPIHRNVLQIFVETLEDAGYSRKQIIGEPIGVFIGKDHTNTMTDSYLSFLTATDFQVMTGSLPGILASRLSYTFNLKGPATVIDTACSSSLVALDTAINSINNGDCETAFVGGANLFFVPENFNADIHSGDYKVRAFDQQAGGTSWGEGVVGIYIKPLSKAVQDGDHIYGVIRGIAVNNDGASNGITAPNARAQHDVLTKAWERAEISPETISYIETHGTGTSLGDSIEIKGLTSAFSLFTNKRQFCAIGSIKTNIGHTIGASGLASVLKVLLSLREKALPPSINFSQPNSQIDFCNSPVYVQDKLAEWSVDKTPRRAGISSFSLNGTNSHLVIEEGPSDNRGGIDDSWLIFPISGRSPELLKKTTSRYLEYLQKHDELRLDDICFTASTGREHHNKRAIVLCRDSSSLLAGLQSLYEMLDSGDLENGNLVMQREKFTIVWGPTENSPIITNNAVDVDVEANKLVSNLADPTQKEIRNEWERLCNYYVQGAEIQFVQLFSEMNVKRCSLPPQVFNNQRYWDESKQNTPVAQTWPTDQEQMTADMLWKKFREASSRLSDDSRNETEAFIAWSWSEILGYPVINPMDDFYSLGGDSITGLRIIQILDMGYGLDLSASNLMGAPVFKDFVKSVMHELNEEGLYSQVDVEDSGQEEAMPDKSESPFPLSPPQGRVFLSSGWNPDSLVYNVTAVRQITGFHNINEIESIIKKVIQRHESLRTSFHLEGDTPVQVVHKKVDFNVERRWLETKVNMSKVELMNRELKDFIRPFDLSKAPLLRVGYFEFDDNDCYLVIDFHHIITDGTSMGIFFSDYLRLASGEKLLPLPLQYRDWVDWVNHRKNDKQFMKTRQWWVDMFVDGIPIINLPTDKYRPAVRDFRGSRIFHMIPNELLNQVKGFAKSSKATLFMVLIAVFHNLLARLSGDRDIVIGTPVSGRPRTEFQNLVGMFINTLPIRTQSQHQESFLDFLDRLKTTMLEAYQNQEYPYESLISDLKLERDPSRNPLFDVYFALQNIDMGITGDEGEKLIDFDSGTAKFDLTVVARETEEGLIMEWEFSESLYRPSTVERMASHYQFLLASTVLNANKNLDELEIIDEQERNLLLNEWNDTTTSYTGKQGIVSIFEEVVSNNGETTALIIDNKHMNYNQLNKQSNQIARAIIEHGGTPNSPVGILLDRSFDMIAAIIGVLKAGCYYVPLDAELPLDRLQTMINDCDTELLVTHNDLGDEILGSEPIDLSIMDLDNLDPNLPTHNIGIEVNGTNKAYIKYTSGSTGNPKGTVIRQEGVIRVVRDSGYLNIQHDDVLLQLSNYSFDGAVFDIFGALLNGASLVLLHKSEVTEPKQLARRIRQNGVSVFFITTALFNALVEAAPECFDHTRKVLFGGEAASIHHVRKAFERLGSGRLIHVYGPTETTVFATYYPVNEVPENQSLPIGKAIGNTTLYVLDEQMRLQPLGVPGELYIGGQGLAVGYLNQPDFTAEEFLESPFKINERIYRTGDMVVWGEDGYLRFFGRRDKQIKLRGYRIELSEIERHTLQYSDVREAYADVYTTENGSGRNLCIWVTSEGNPTNFDTKGLHKLLTQKLPDYMVPNFIIPMEKLHLNKNGKVDKKMLTPPAMIVEGKRKESRNEREEILVDIWLKVLGVTPSVDDNFFALGGDSIKAIQVIARVQDMGLEMVMADLFQYQTVESLTPHLREKQRVNIEQGEVYGHSLPTVIQSSLLDNEHLPNHFTQLMGIYGIQHLEQNRLENALTRVCSHHDFLRLVIDSNKNLRLKKQDEGNLFHLIELPSHMEEDQLHDSLIKAQQQIDLYNGPLLVAVARYENKELYLAIHHLAVDVVSWTPILEDISTILANPKALLPKKTTPFPEWTRAVTEWAKNGGAKDELPYWREVAKEAQDIVAPFPEVTSRYEETSSVKHWIDRKTSQYLCGEGNQAFHTETVHLFLAFLSRALSSFAQTSALLVNLEGHGREPISSELDVSRTVGWFTSRFPIVLRGNGDVKDAIKLVKESIRGIPHRGFGFGVLKSLTPDLSQEDKDMLEQLRPVINFNYLGKQEESNQDGIVVENLSTELAIDKNYQTEWALDIIAFQSDSGICIDIRYPNKLFTDREMEILLNLLDEAAIEVANCCLDYRYGEKTASDFTVTPLQQDEFEDILEDLDINR